jgi:hypothetical protein
MYPFIASCLLNEELQSNTFVKHFKTSELAILAVYS